VEHLQFCGIVSASDRWTCPAPVMSSITVLYEYRLCVYVCVCVSYCHIQVHNCKHSHIINSLTLSRGTFRTLRLQFL